ncbi:YdcF family protein [Thioalkalivibrio paradoxus]|uniref:DUF218 domain-containing protein n=1 Tax=Thioalkalivibrio paradoxus ARh 1 TaxID=713585 RepID=W0DRV0_9GAMM|nr:ElyC/SanA/YdcF family protein [Thioalkalivibrio paradoxus]AHF00003.1 hypothetical protein THITH_05990 [Thioalkalivibrio paradoxus ARh 1]
MDTAQEAYAVREFLGTETRFFLVTSASHMPRSVRHFERVGLAPIPAPTGFKTGSERVRTLAYWVPSAGNLGKTERVVHEYLGLLTLELDLKCSNEPLQNPNSWIFLPARSMVC